MLEFDHVSKVYRSGVFGTHLTKAVNDISFQIGRGETIGLLGESGCGKSTIARLAMRLLTPSAGEIRYDGKNIQKLSKAEMKDFRRNVQIIFQNPQQAFNPRMRLYETIAEPVHLYQLASPQQEQEFIRGYMDRIGLSEELLVRHPHEISGGQAQRIAILRILMLQPRLIIADEPTTMLDVSVQAQILNMMRRLVSQENISLLFVSHDLDVIRAMCSSIIVMKDGQIREINTTEEIFSHPRDEYTKYLVGKG